jgi:hypothetical protein
MLYYFEDWNYETKCSCYTFAMASYVRYMLPGNQLNPNDSLVSANGRYKLTYDLFSNLALFDMGPEPAVNIWSANSGPFTPVSCALDVNGNLVVTDLEGAGVHFQTGTSTPIRRGTMLVLQDDGNLVLYGMTVLCESRVGGTPFPPPAAAVLIAPPPPPPAVQPSVPTAEPGGFNLNGVVNTLDEASNILKDAFTIFSLF